MSKLNRSLSEKDNKILQDLKNEAVLLIERAFVSGRISGMEEIQSIRTESEKKDIETTEEILAP